METPYSKSAEMTGDEIMQGASKLGLNCKLIDLAELDSLNSICAVIHTGKEKNEYNNGYTNHWLAIYGKYMFDSYGKYGAWETPDWVEEVDTVPKAVQSYNSNVCGQYCLAYLSFAKESDGSDDVGREFATAFDFGKDREENDEKILEWFNSI